MKSNRNKLKLKRLGIDTQQEFVVYMRHDCDVCQSEGFEALTRIHVHFKERSIIATLNVVHSGLLHRDEVGLSESALKKLDAREGEYLTFSHIPRISSLSDIRSKMYGNRLNEAAMRRIIADITGGMYSNIHLAAFLTACAGDSLNIVEIDSLTIAMVDSGTRLEWPYKMVVDKHCVGGLPGNRTTPIVVAIAASAGLVIPKTSSRAITSPAGTADTMETMTPVNLSMKQVRSVIEKENGCIIWGGSVNLSPADDLLIKVERALDVDSEGQMIASVLSKKVAAGSTHVVIDIPVGLSAKVRNGEDALKLKYYFTAVGNAIGLKVKVMITDGSQPVGRGIGPALEAKDVIGVLKNDPKAPQDLKERALSIAGTLLELAENVNAGQGVERAREILQSGSAWNKFVAICEAQGGFKEPGSASNVRDIVATDSGQVSSIDNRKLANVAKLAGAPHDACSGVEFFAPLGTKIDKGDILYRIHADTKGQLQYALEYVKEQNNIIQII